MERTREPASRTGGPFDGLVELHVLAEHGDVDARAAAQAWMERDPAARRHWLDVERDCRLVREPGA